MGESLAQPNEMAGIEASAEAWNKDLDTIAVLRGKYAAGESVDEEMYDFLFEIGLALKKVEGETIPEQLDNAEAMIREALERVEDKLMTERDVQAHLDSES
jgi:hypothetical protein